jgi:hypothetical protein
MLFVEVVEVVEVVLSAFCEEQGVSCGPAMKG